MYQAKHDGSRARQPAAPQGAKHLKQPRRARGRRRNQRRHPLRRFLLAVVLLGVLCYTGLVLAPVAGIRYWRDIYIETAMTTAHHKWLATYFIPAPIIREVMSHQSTTVDGIGGLDVHPAQNPSPAPTPAPPDEAAPEPIATPTPTPAPDILGQAALTVGEPNALGDRVLVNDREQGIVVLEVTGDNFVGHLALIDDPARVFVAHTGTKDSRGTLICDYLTEYDAVLGMNANGFADEGGHGNGGTIAGLSRAGGENWGTYQENYVSLCFDAQNRLLVGLIDDWDAYGIRDGAQFKPALIIDGEIVTAGSNGWGLQPRSCIGQRADGAVLMLVVDGRQVGYSIGATVGECAAVLQKYGAVNASCCDGGSSSVLAYNGALQGVPSTSMKSTGRWLPNAFLVRRRLTDAPAQ